MEDLQITVVSKDHLFKNDLIRYFTNQNKKSKELYYRGSQLLKKETPLPYSRCKYELYEELIGLMTTFKVVLIDFSCFSLDEIRNIVLPKSTILIAAHEFSHDNREKIEYFFSQQNDIYLLRKPLISYELDFIIAQIITF